MDNSSESSDQEDQNDHEVERSVKKKPKGKWTRERPILLYEGSLLSLDTPELRARHLDPLLEIFTKNSLDPLELLKGWTIRVKERMSGMQPSLTYCDYIDGDGLSYNSRVLVARFFGLEGGRERRKGSSHRQDGAEEDEAEEGLTDRKKKKSKKYDSDHSSDERRVKSGKKKKKNTSDDSSQEEIPHRKSKRFNDLDEAAADSGSDDEFEVLEPDWGPTGDMPTKRRQKLLAIHIQDMKTLVDRLYRIDSFNHFRTSKKRSASKLGGGGPTSLKEIRRKVWSYEYLIRGREATLSWNQLAKDVENTVKVILQDTSYQVVGAADSENSYTNPSHCGKRLLEAAFETCQAGESALKVAFDSFRQEEEVDWLGDKNKEPAMPRWRKELMQSYKYELLNHYEPADGLLPEEKSQLLEKLIDKSSKGNRWVYPEGLEMVDLWAEVVALDRSELPLEMKPLPNVKDVMLPELITEQHTWGIDCFSRRNIEIALTKSVRNLQHRMSLAQIRYFIEMILLKEIQAYRPIEEAWDMRLSLRKIIEKADSIAAKLHSFQEQVELTNEAISISNDENHSIVGEAHALQNPKKTNELHVAVNANLEITKTEATLNGKEDKIVTDKILQVDDESGSKVFMKNSLPEDKLEVKYENNKEIDVEKDKIMDDPSRKEDSSVSVRIDDQIKQGFIELQANEKIEPNTVGCSLCIQTEVLSLKCCPHVFCRDCFQKIKSSSERVCPFDKKPFILKQGMKAKEQKLIQDSQKLLEMPEPMSFSEENDKPIELNKNLLHRRLKIYSKSDRIWSLGRIIDHREVSEFLVAYDDGNNVWEDLSKVEFRLIGVGMRTIYDTNISCNQIRTACEVLLDQYEKRDPKHFAIHSKGIGIITNVPIEPGKLVQKYTGILYPCWLWEQKEAKEDAERLELKRKTGEILLPDFWNMRLELPKGEDEEGIDLLHVDAKLGGNFASRMSHSCRPNCGTMTAVIDGQYCIGMRALRKIEAGEELTIDYNCVTDSMDEFRAAICLCGAHDCRGSFLYITGATQQMLVVDRSHCPLHRVAMLFSSCYETGELEKAFGKPPTQTWPIWVSPEERLLPKKKARGKNKLALLKEEEDISLTATIEKEDDKKLSPIVLEVLKERGLGKRALCLLPNWAFQFAAHLVEFINCEELELARVEYNKSTVSDPDERWRIAKLESKGVADQRVTNLVIALDKARHYMCERITKNLTSENNERSQLRERWWVSDRCLARWVGDDADEYPDWYPATVTHVYVQQQELRVDYDTSEVNRIPINLAQRPNVDQIPPPFTGCDVAHHQPPFRVLDEDEILFSLWTDENSGVAIRLLNSIQKHEHFEYPLWQLAYDPAIKRKYWWNFETREIRLTKPSSEKMALKTHFEPKVFRQIQKLIKEKKVSTGEEARKALRDLRDLVLRIPPLNRELDDMHQKAADLLTLYSLTRNFFVLREPEMDSSKAHAVISALTSWIGQGVESRVVDIVEMIGNALLPCIERAYDANCGLGYSGTLRSTLINHIRQDGLNPWPKSVIGVFPHASELPPQPADLEKQWPHPVPPVRLFGSPALDSAIFDHLDYTRSCALAREAGPKKERDMLVFEENRGLKNLQYVAYQLKEKRRDHAKLDPEDRTRFTAPPLPDLNSAALLWAQCEKPDCGKWRRLPFGFDKSKIPTPFFCSQLVEIADDDGITDCSAPQEEEQVATVSWEDRPLLNMDHIKNGDYVDAFDGSEWKIAIVLETLEDSVKVKYISDNEAKTEWHPKKLDPTDGMAFASLATLHTYTPETRKLKDYFVPYETICPEANPDVARCVNSLVARVEKEYFKFRKHEGKLQKRLLRAANRNTSNVVDLVALSNSPFGAGMDNSQKSCFYNFFAKEREYDPSIPFIRVLARWSLLDQSQKLSWEVKMQDTTFAPTPKLNQVFVAPSLLANNRLTTRKCTFLDDEDASRRFYAELDQIVVGVPVETDYGQGIISDVTQETVIVTLIWGGKAYIPIPQDLSIQVPMFSAVPNDFSTRFLSPDTSRRGYARQVQDEDSYEEDGKRKRKSIDGGMKKKPRISNENPLLGVLDSWRLRWIHLCEKV